MATTILQSVYTCCQEAYSSAHFLSHTPIAPQKTHPHMTTHTHTHGAGLPQLHYFSEVAFQFHGWCLRERLFMCVFECVRLCDTVMGVGGARQRLWYKPFIEQLWCLSVCVCVITVDIKSTVQVSLVHGAWNDEFFLKGSVKEKRGEKTVIRDLGQEIILCIFVLMTVRSTCILTLWFTWLNLWNKTANVAFFMNKHQKQNQLLHEKRTKYFYNLKDAVLFWKRWFCTWKRLQKSFNATFG